MDPNHREFNDPNMIPCWRGSSSSKTSSFGQESGLNPAAFFPAQRSPNFQHSPSLTPNTATSFIPNEHSFTSPPPPKRLLLSPNPKGNRYDSRPCMTDTRTFSPRPSSQASRQVFQNAIVTTNEDLVLKIKWSRN